MLLIEIYFVVIRSLEHKFVANLFQITSAITNRVLISNQSELLLCSMYLGFAHWSLSRTSSDSVQ